MASGKNLVRTSVQTSNADKFKMVHRVTEYYTEGSLDEKSVTRMRSCQGGECLDALAGNFIPASALRHSPP